MTRSIDDIYATTLSLSQQMARLPADSPERARLEQQRNDLRAQAALLSVQGRHPESVAREIEAIEERLRELDAMLITEGYAERRGGKNIQDPGAYSATINRLLSDQHLDEVNKLTEQLARLRLQHDPAHGDEPDR